MKNIYSEAEIREACEYFTSLSCDPAPTWTVSKISKLCEALYGEGVTPQDITHWAVVHKRRAKKL